MEKSNSRIIRVALIGPESTSKSTLSEELAAYYNTNVVKEYAREYLSGLNRKYTLNDVLKIAKHQLSLEKKLLKFSNKFLIVDTELIISKIWCEDVFGTCPSWIEENIKKHQYDIYLLTYPDLPWVWDELRENKTRRLYFFRKYETELKKINATYVVIKGKGKKRLQNCIDAITQFLQQREN